MKKLPEIFFNQEMYTKMSINLTHEFDENNISYIMVTSSVIALQLLTLRTPSKFIYHTNFPDIIKTKYWVLLPEGCFSFMSACPINLFHYLSLNHEYNQ